MKKIDFTKLPYRGIMRTVSKKLNIANQNVSRRYNDNDPIVVKAVNEEVKNVNRIIKEKYDLIRESQDVAQ